MSATSEKTLSPQPARRAPFGAVARRGWVGLTFSTPLAARELAPVGVLLLALGALVYGGHVTHGSFYYDDWAQASFTTLPPHPGYVGALQFYFSTFGFRPVVAVYYPTLYAVLGLHQHLQIAWAVFLGVAASWTLYLVLRTLALERLHAFLIAALVLLFPFSDSTILWPTAATGHLVLVLYFVGLLLALRGLRSETRRSALLCHVGSVVCYIAAVTTYEVVATVALGSVVIYLWKCERRRALKRFAVDVVTIVAALAWTASHSTIDQVSSTGGGLHHAIRILGQGLYIIAGAVVPFGSPAHLLIVGIALAALLAGGALWFQFLRGTTAGADVRRWLIIAVAGAVWAYAAWAIFVPADPYYEPTGVGVGNRTNVVAAVGLVAGAYALIMLLGTLGFSRSRWRIPLTSAFAVLVAIFLGTGYTRQVSTDVTHWDLATSYQYEVLGALKHEIPRPVPNATIYAYGYPLFTAPGVPTFAATWDLNGAVQLTYHDRDLHGYPLETAASTSCGVRSMYPAVAGYGPQRSAAYGQGYLLDVSTRRAYRPLNQAQCEAAVTGRSSQ